MEGRGTGEATAPVSAGPRPPAEEGGMSQSYHEIFDTQGYRVEEGVTSPEDSTPVEEGSAGSGASGSTETGLEHDTGEMGAGVYYDEGAGRLEGGDPGTTTKYLTSKLVADSLMWRQTFRDDSSSPEECPEAAHPTARPASPGPQEASLGPGPVDPQVLNDMELEARQLATEVDGLVENLSCILQSISALTVDTVETYRDGVCKTCDEVDNNIKCVLVSFLPVVTLTPAPQRCTS
jgi:hypothetical protein